MEQDLKDLWKFIKRRAKRFFTVSTLYKCLGCVILFILILSAGYAALSNSGLQVEIFKLKSWSPLLEKEFFKELFFTPLWLLATFFFGRADASEYANWKKQKNRLEGFLYKKEEVTVKDVLKFLVNDYSIEDEYGKEEDAKEKVVEESEGLVNDDLILG